MLSLDPILCPVDFSELSAHALRFAAHLASVGSGRILAAYANSFEAPPYFTEGRIEELRREFVESREAAERGLKEFAESALGSRPAAIETRVIEGLPADVIRKLASETPAGVIVMGTHGRTGYNRWTLGSVAERVLRESSVPVATVRGEWKSPIRRILCPVNDTEVSRKALSTAADLAKRLDADLTALYVEEAHAANRIPNLCAWIPAEERARCSISELVRRGDPPEEIVGLTSEQDFGLLVIGAPRRKFFQGMVLGRTTLRAVRHAPCPVLTVGD